MKMVFNMACIRKANKLSVGLSGFSLSEHSQHWGQNKSVITAPLSPIATPTRYLWQGGRFSDLLCLLIFKSFVDFYVCASLHENITPHACRNSQRLEEDVGSPGPGAPGSNEPYSGALSARAVLHHWAISLVPLLLTKCNKLGLFHFTLHRNCFVCKLVLGVSCGSHLHYHCL